MTAPQERRGVSPASAALTGLVVGIATGVVATALSRKETRQKVAQRADELGQSAQKTYNQLTTQANQAWEKQIQPKIQDIESKARKARKSNQEIAEQATKEVEELAVKGGEVVHQAEDKAEDDDKKRK